MFEIRIDVGCVQPQQLELGAQRGLLVALRMLLCAMLLFGPAQAWAAGEAAASLLERRVKAALLFRFVNYVDWPESAFSSPSRGPPNHSASWRHARPAAAAGKTAR